MLEFRQGFAELLAIPFVMVLAASKRNISDAFLGDLAVFFFKNH